MQQVVYIQVSVNRQSTINKQSINKQVMHRYSISQQSIKWNIIVAEAV